ncbi:MAG TPA: hypothetical protein VF974_00985 [Patescibacteria group bacterium]
MNTLMTLELAQMRTDAYAVVFDKKCTIKRDSQTFDSKGGSPDNYIDIADNIPCAMVGLSMPVQSMLAGQNVGIDARTLHTPFGTDIMVNDEVTINNVIYRVLAPYGEKTIQIFTSVIIQKRTMA